ncbi:unnamed protein product [Acanthoscelides obtectus]|uniref:Uncharacterized protein n=1 Tax=Acanthoscelides obtectus TaxID=200917 RepID=A0A9P0LAC2_ACAOB|nr:unnamed protein product [Acanthoscelides obtectus]CAK1621582.1 hypothetical protein AOBTE_LOCUS1027 [Acanthoscelides obtectus]
MIVLCSLNHNIKWVPRLSGSFSPIEIGTHDESYQYNKICSWHRAILYHRSFQWNHRKFDTRSYKQSEFY